MGFLKKLTKGIGTGLRAVSPTLAKLGIPVVSQVAGGFNLATGIKDKLTAQKKPQLPMKVGGNTIQNVVAQKQQIAQAVVFDQQRLSQIAEPKLDAIQQTVFKPQLNSLKAEGDGWSIDTKKKKEDDKKKWYQNPTIIGGIIAGVLAVFGLIYLVTRKRK